MFFFILIQTFFYILHDAPAPLFSRGRPSAAEQTQRRSTFPRRIRSHADRCSRLTRQGRAE